MILVVQNGIGGRDISVKQKKKSTRGHQSEELKLKT